MSEANIFNIQHFSVHDGPGIRTVVFFKGCNLHCLWCHNPESIHSRREILLYEDRCIGCGECEKNCPTGANRFSTDENGVHHVIDRQKCIYCFACCDACYADALVSVGESWSTERIFREIIRNKEYFSQSGGGVTFSGGECMLQINALRELLEMSRQEGIHTAVDTAGNVPWSSFEQIKEYTDLFLYDVKAVSSEVHRRCTGVGNERILDNLDKLVRNNQKVRVRIPYIPGYNSQELPAIAEFLNKYPEINAELLAYHSMGNSKYQALQSDENITAEIPDKQLMENLRQQYGFQ